MPPWSDPHLQARQQEPQASDRLECKDGVCYDDRWTKSVASVGNTPESARRYSSLGPVGKRDQNWLQPASIPRADRRDHLASSNHEQSASSHEQAEYTGWHLS